MSREEELLAKAIEAAFLFGVSESKPSGLPLDELLKDEEGSKENEM